MQVNKLIILVLLASYYSCADESFVCANNEPKNLAELKKEIVNYYTSGSYEKDVVCIVQQIIDYINSQMPLPKNTAVVLDIDDTVLCNFDFNYKQDFGYNPSQWNEWEQSSSSPAIKPMLKLYRFIRDQGIRTFFITGRRPYLRESTERNLVKAGFYPWDGIYFRPDSYTLTSRIPFKTAIRKLLEEQGYYVLLTIGDQYSDLMGGYAKKAFKIPNPIYYIP